MLGEDFLPLGASDWTSIISKLKKAHPDALITSTAGGAPNVTLTKQLRAAGVNIPYGNLAIDEGTAKKIGPPATGMFFAASYLTDLKNQKNKTYMAALQKMFGNKLKTPNDLSEPQYDAIYLYKHAVEKAGTTAPQAVIKDLGKVSFTGPRGKIQMNKEHYAPLPIYIAQVKKGGHIKVIEHFKKVDPGNQCPSLAH